MTTYVSNQFQKPAYSGQDAYAVAHGGFALPGAQIGDKVRLRTLYAGTFITDAKIVNAALGAGTTVSLGFEYTDGSDGVLDDASLIPATATNAAGCTRSNVAPILLTKDAYLVAVIGGGVATGQIDAVVGFEFRGSL